MIQKMPTDNYICDVCADIAKVIPKLEKKRDDLAKKVERHRISAKKREEAEHRLEWQEHRLQDMKDAYKAILGVEYGSEQTHEVYKYDMNKYLFCTLYQRGITKVEYEDIEPRDDKAYARIYWTEKIDQTGGMLS